MQQAYLPQLAEQAPTSLQARLTPACTVPVSCAISGHAFERQSPGACRALYHRLDISLSKAEANFEELVRTLLLVHWQPAAKHQLQPFQCEYRPGVATSAAAKKVWKAAILELDNSTLKGLCRTYATSAPGKNSLVWADE